MVNFMIAYKNPYNGCTVESMVYAVNTNNFLVVDAYGYFLWVPMRDCKLVGNFDDTEG